MAKSDPATNPLFSRHLHRNNKHKDAVKRNEEWRKLTFAEQIEALDIRFGEGKGATKQRARIVKAMEEAKKPKKGEKNKRERKTKEAK
jgi:hypothetical protein